MAASIIKKATSKTYEPALPRAFRQISANAAAAHPPTVNRGKSITWWWIFAGRLESIPKTKTKTKTKKTFFETRASLTLGKQPIPNSMKNRGMKKPE
jgi:hypothetical protein